MVHCYLGKGCRTCMCKHTSFFFLKIVTIKKTQNRLYTENYVCMYT